MSKLHFITQVCLVPSNVPGCSGHISNKLTRPGLCYWSVLEHDTLHVVLYSSLNHLCLLDVKSVKPESQCCDGTCLAGTAFTVKTQSKARSYILFLQELAQECMAHDPASRPTFQQIEERLTKLQASVQPTPGKGFLRSGGTVVKAAA